MNTKELVDLVVEKIRANNADARASALTKLQMAEDELCSMKPWWFLWRQQDLTFTEEERNYSFAPEVMSVEQLFDANGLELVHLPWLAWARLYEGSSVSETRPLLWTLRPQVATSNIVIVSVWPVPETTENGQAFVRLGSETLADNEANEPRMPEQYRQWLAYRAIELIAEEEEKVQLAEVLKSRRDTLFSALLVEDAERQVKQRD